MAGPDPKRITTSSLKDRILNLAQTSVYSVKIQPPTAVINYINANYDFNYRDVGENIELLCNETTLPGNSLATHEVRSDYMGVTEKMAYRRLYDDTIDMSFYVDKNYYVIDFFDAWMDYITGKGISSPSNNYADRRTGFRMNYPIEYKSDIYLTKFEKDNADAALYYTFVEAFPIQVNSTPVSYAQSDLLRLNVSFSYVRYFKQSTNLK